MSGNRTLCSRPTGRLVEMVENFPPFSERIRTRHNFGALRLYLKTSHIMGSIVPSQSTKPPPELDARALLVEVDPDEDEEADAVAIATDEEPEEPLAVAMLNALASAEPATASLALNATPSKRPSDAKLFRTSSMDIPPFFPKHTSVCGH